MPMTLLLRLARLIAASISRSLRSAFLSIQAPTVTFRPNSAAIGGTSSTPPVEEYRRIARVMVDSFFRSARIFSDRRHIVDVGMGAALERRVGDARQNAAEIGRRLLFLEQAPQPGVSCGHKQQNGDDGTHRRLNHTGLQFRESEPVP